MTLGEKVVRTKNEVLQDSHDHPNNALKVVCKIDLNSSEPPTAKIGKILVISPQRSADADLEALGFDYRDSGNCSSTTK